MVLAYERGMGTGACQEQRCEHDDPEGTEPGQDDCPRCIEARSHINQAEEEEDGWMTMRKAGLSQGQP